MNTIDRQFPNQENVSPMMTALKIGLIGGMVYIILSVIFYLFDLTTGTSATVVSIIQFGVLVVTAVAAIKIHRDQDLGGFMKYGRGLGTGTLTGLFAGILIAIYMFIFLQFIDPGMMEEQLERQREDMLERGMSDGDIDRALDMAGMFTQPWIVAIGSLVSTVFWMFLVSLIASIFLKRESKAV